MTQPRTHIQSPTDILAVDPGLMTGAMLITRAETPDYKLHAQLGFKEFAEFLDNVSCFLRVIVVERYIISLDTIKKSRQSDALEVIGMLRYFSVTEDIPIVYQTAAQAKRMISDESLRNVGWYTRGLEHGNDAARHMLFYYLKQGWAKAEGDEGKLVLL
jgi:hypothetical protein